VVFKFEKAANLAFLLHQQKKGQDIERCSIKRWAMKMSMPSSCQNDDLILQE